MTTRRDFIKSAPALGAAFAVAPAMLGEDGLARAQGAAPLPEHFHPKGKAPSEHTLRILAEARETLPFSDTRDFDEQARGLIAEMPQKQIMADAGHVAWDKARFDFLNEDREWDSIHPSMLRQARLNQDYGLYEVLEGQIYQVRGFDLSQISFVRGETGWICFDPLISAEVARAAWEFFQEHRGEGLPLTAVIYSHSHTDHWGGVRGIVDEADVRAGKVEIIAPRDFMEFTISENVYAGNAMNRRLSFQYGQVLPVAPHGFVTQGLGQGVSAGEVGLIAPSKIVEADIEYLDVDGVRMVFQNTPDTEAPSEMNTYIPEMKALWMAENVVSSLHNIYTLRGAPVRDPLRWSKYIARALYLFGTEAEVLFASHHWPRWGNDRVQEVLRAQRDVYAHMNNQVLHYANQGVTINQIHEVYEPSEGLKQTWHTRGYHGSPQHNSRGVIQRYLGFWDCNPTTLIPHTPADSAPLYVEMMGGSGPILAKAAELHEAGEYRQATEILDKLVHAEPGNQEAKDALADAFEQLGYQQENPGLRNSFLAGAYELRSGIPAGERASTSGPDVIRAMSTEMFLNFLGIRMDSRQAEGLEFTVNIVTPDNGEKFILELANATLTNIEGFLADDPDLTLVVNRADLERVMIGEAEFEALIGDGTIQAEGDVSILGQLAQKMVDFDPLFEVLPGTSDHDAVSLAANAYEAATGATIPE
ncbi:alkyl/aryl-sulfatase [Ruegeria profundi]|uniref:alkyl/aryl-sulfatase n=1 Tax=Ruegeria profundi TaxID=1685378 RepID=UPI0009EC5F2F|nr:alkyl sulfatase dimerization domain-containing protein [Ruegeria profundi]